MAENFEIRTQAERFIHNDLSNCAHTFSEVTNQKFASGKTDGVGHDMMAALVFTAFSIEAKVNFVGWKILEDGWPERASSKEKIKLLLKILKLDLSWGERPLQTISQLNNFRNTLAHGKPEIVDDVEITNIEPDVWDALKGQWERNVSQEFVNRCREDEKEMWHKLLNAANISVTDTITSGHIDRTLIEELNL